MNSDDSDYDDGDFGTMDPDYVEELVAKWKHESTAILRFLCQ